MVSVINAPAFGSHTFEAFQAAAKALLNTTTTAVAPPAITPPPPSSTDAAPPAASPPATHTITVGADHQKIFSPANITATVGDQVVFLFVADNHTATQSNFDTSCETLLESTSVPGFDSGLYVSTRLVSCSTVNILKLNKIANLSILVTPIPLRSPSQ
jgi:plastocyanin